MYKRQGLTFVAYFYPIRDLLSGFVPHFDESGFLVFDSFTAIFWTLFFTGMTYMNAGFLREQVCKYMCPYARFQSVMYDEDTLAVHYDVSRGESRGPRKPGEDYAEKGLGDCIDCSWCVQVCPVDIDIRDGLQYECINCGLCVDACNTVMDKMDYSRGLIRFTSEDELESGKTQFLRFRVFAYIGILVILSGLFVYTVANRQPVIVDVTRDRGTQMFQVRQGDVQNIYMVKINNMQRGEQIYTISLEADLPFTIVKNRPVLLEEGEIYAVPIRVSIPQEKLNDVSTDITFIITDIDNPEVNTFEKTNFIGPQK